MTIHRLERDEWSSFCVRASRLFMGKHVEFEIGSLQIGFQHGARRLPLLGMAYDPKNDVLELSFGELEHLIHAPREFYVDEALPGAVSLQIIDSEGARQIVILRDPPMLPPPHGY